MKSVVLSRSIFLSFRCNSKADHHPKNVDRFMFYLNTLPLPDFTDSSTRFTKQTKSRRGDHPNKQTFHFPWNDKKSLCHRCCFQPPTEMQNESKSCNIMCTGPQGRTGGGGGGGGTQTSLILYFKQTCFTDSNTYRPATVMPKPSWFIKPDQKCL